MATKPRKRPAAPRRQPPARLNEGRDFTREGHAIVVTVTGFERMASAIMSGRAVYARVGANVVLRVLAK